MAFRSSFPLVYESKISIACSLRLDEAAAAARGASAPHLNQAAVQQIEREGAKAIAEIEQRRDHELSILDKLTEKARELAVEVKERTVRRCEDGTGFLRGRQGGGCGEGRAGQRGVNSTSLSPGV
jgi:hypothetical protein